ncbi:MAG: dihydrofolate reductase [Flavobacteriaceae bacterium]
MNSEGTKDTKSVDDSIQNGSFKNSKVTLIAAIDEHSVLGKDNQLIWHLPEDLKRFKHLTTGHAVIMGRKTFESLPKALPNRHNIVVTRNQNYSKEGITVCHSLEAAIECAKDDDQPFIIGGGQIYQQAIGLADVIELTKIHAHFEGDVFFPEIDLGKWTVEKEERMDQPDYDYSFITYTKK